MREGLFPFVPSPSPPAFPLPPTCPPRWQRGRAGAGGAHTRVRVRVRGCGGGRAAGSRARSARARVRAMHAPGAGLPAEWPWGRGAGRGAGRQRAAFLHQPRLPSPGLLTLQKGVRPYLPWVPARVRAAERSSKYLAGKTNKDQRGQNGS